MASTVPSTSSFSLPVEVPSAESLSKLGSRSVFALVLKFVQFSKRRKLYSVKVIQCVYLPLLPISITRYTHREDGNSSVCRNAGTVFKRLCS
jgi:hypothetical protein